MSTINGLPAHILLVHAVVVLVPLSALGVVLVALWPAARRRLAWPTAVLAVLALIAVPLTTEAGEWLEHHITASPLVRTHTELGDSMLPWAIGLAVVALGLLGWHLRESRSRRDGGRVLVTIVAGVLAAVVAVGSVITVYRIGDSGARAAWTGQFTEQAQTPEGPDGPPPS